MRDYPIEKYRFYKTRNNTVIAETTYAGKKVRASAKVSPEDEFDPDFGKKLASARCNEKVAVRRKKRAEKKLEEAKKILEKAEVELAGAMAYFDDATKDLTFAEKRVADVLAEIS